MLVQRVRCEVGLLQFLAALRYQTPLLKGYRWLSGDVPFLSVGYFDFPKSGQMLSAQLFLLTQQVKLLVSLQLVAWDTLSKAGSQ
jgi:hypothetical protein